MPTFRYVPIPVSWRVISFYRKEPRHYGRVFNLKANRIAFEIRFSAHCPPRVFYIVFSRLSRSLSRLLNSRTFVLEKKRPTCRRVRQIQPLPQEGETDVTEALNPLTAF